MDLDTEINMALDTISDSSTQLDPDSNLPFEITYNDNGETIGDEMYNKIRNVYKLLKEDTK